MNFILNNDGRHIEFTDEEIATRDMHYLVEKAYGQNRGGGYLGKQGWFVHHANLLRNELGLGPKPDMPTLPSQATPSSFSEFWRRTSGIDLKETK